MEKEPLVRQGLRLYQCLVNELEGHENQVVAFALELTVAHLFCEIAEDVNIHKALETFNQHVADFIGDMRREEKEDDAT